MRDKDRLHLTVDAVHDDFVAARLDYDELWALDEEGQRLELIAKGPSGLGQVVIKGDYDWAPLLKVVNPEHPRGNLVSLFRSEGRIEYGEDEITVKGSGSGPLAWCPWTDVTWQSRFGAGDLVIAPVSFFKAWERDFQIPGLRARLSSLGA